MNGENTRKKLFYCRICLWIIALVATIYWIYWSFHLYTLGYYDEHAYAAMLRPIFSKALFVSLVAVGISFILRRISDNIKDREKAERAATQQRYQILYAYKIQLNGICYDYKTPFYQTKQNLIKRGFLFALMHSSSIILTYISLPYHQWHYEVYF